jgi:YbbR domain-containing protein
MRKNLHIMIIALIFSMVIWASISLSNDYYATFDVPVKVVNFPGGYTTGTNLPENVSVKLKGQGWKLLSINLGAESEYVISAGGDSGRKFVNLYNYLVENQWLSSDLEVIDITPDTLSFTVERIISKRVKILPDLSLDFRKGYGLASAVKLNPDSVTVYGPVNYITELQNVYTEKLEIDRIDSRVYENVRLASGRGITYSNNVVGVSLDVQQIMEKEFTELPVEIMDIPSDRNVVLLPNKISIGVRGGIDILGRLKTDDFRAYVYYRDVVLDTTGSVLPRIDLPGNTSFLYSKPERLRYIIKKFD